MNPKHQPFKRYDEEFKRNAVELMESSGRPIAEVASDLGLPYKTLERWKAKYRRERTLPGKARSQPEDRVLEQLRRKLAHVERERDILKKALAICSRELDPKGDSD
jgi:transposase